MKTLIGQLPALIGVATGALATLVATTFTDRARWRRDQSVRWDVRRFEAYTAFAFTLKEILLLAFRSAAPKRPTSEAVPIDYEEAQKLLAEANIRRSQTWKPILLLADPTTVSAASTWRDAVHAVELISRGAEIDEEQWRLAVRAVNVARDNFYACARRSLETGAGSVTQAQNLRYWEAEPS